MKDPSLVIPGTPSIKAHLASAFASKVYFLRAWEMTCFGSQRVPLLTQIEVYNGSKVIFQILNLFFQEQSAFDTNHIQICLKRPIKVLSLLQLTKVDTFVNINASDSHEITSLCPYTNYTIKLKQRPENGDNLWSRAFTYHFSTLSAGKDTFNFGSWFHILF